MIFSIEYYTVWGESLRLVSGDNFWPMSWGEGNVWSVKITKPVFSEYHYEVFKEGRMLRRELGDHHLLKVSLRAQQDKWMEWPVKRGAGTAVPVFSLRSEDDFGIGDFRDLRLLVDWAKICGQSVIQLLPVNDTTRKGDWEDSYPYSPISSFALNPMYIRLQELFPEDSPIENDENFIRDRKKLNASDELDYPAVFAAKMKYLHKAYELSGAKDIKSKDFCAFALDNAFWLEEYADFCAARDKTKDRDFYRWVQFWLDIQFREETIRALKMGVIFKGDLPIGVSRDSVEVAVHPELFNLDCSAGAPPDFFTADGQNWGFPTYNWEAMEKNDFHWWKTRLNLMSRYFGAYRIDHVLGWFRIWEIPLSATSGKQGYFNPALPYGIEELHDFFDENGIPDSRLFIPYPRNKGCWCPLISPDTSFLSEDKKRQFDRLWEDFFFHRNEDFWRENAEKKIPALLSASGMLPCAEDLGMVPKCVNEVMEKYRILSLELINMDKGRPWPYLSVSSTSTHDMNPLRCSEGEDREPLDCLFKIKGVLESDSMLTILPLQDWLSINGEIRAKNASSERINDPANPHHHWRWRMHIPLEALLAEKGDAAILRSDIEALLLKTNRFIG